MSKYIRGYERFEHAFGNYPTPLWQEVEKNVRDTIGIKPFDATHPSTYDSFAYLPSQHRTTRFELVDGHSRYQSDLAINKSIKASDLTLGPVEIDIISFASSPNPQLCVLVGGAGSGKSTTLNYLKTRCFADNAVILCDLDACMDVCNANADHLADIDVAGVLVRSLSPWLNNLISPGEEWKDLWTWGLSQEAGRNHPAKNILSDAANILRNQLGDDWLSESTVAINIRKNCHSDLIQKPLNHLIYEALRIDYYLTCCCNDDRSRFLLILDNVDPLPPHAQFQIQELASRMQTSAHCKILLSMRPLTYSSNLQAANRTVEVIEHIGPSVIDLIEYRVNNAIIKINMPMLEVRIPEDGYNDRTINQGQVKDWIREVLFTLKQDRRHCALPGEPNARTFIEGLCGHSLRCALVIGSKIFGSAVIPVFSILGTDYPKRTPRQRVRDHEIIRAILEGWHCHFEACRGRVTDNLFDLGVISTSRSCTCKVRLLKKLEESNTGVVTLGELRTHLSRFGYDTQVILDAVNGVISQYKRLAWSDSVAQYVTLDGFQSSKIKISDAGRFYINYAMFNLEYVQAVHVDVLLPREETLEHDLRNFADRARSLELFVRYLNQQDNEEVLRVLFNNAANDYNTVYNGSLFSIEIIIALARQIENVGKSLLAGKLGHERKVEIQGAINRWVDLAYTINNSASELIKKLANTGC